MENFFGCQRQRGGTSDHPNTKEYFQNAQALRVVNSFCRPPVNGNCKGAKTCRPASEDACIPLPKKEKEVRSVATTIVSDNIVYLVHDN